MKKSYLLNITVALLGVFFTDSVFAQAANNVNLPGLSVNFGQGTDLVDTMQVLVLFTILTLAPAFIILCTLRPAISPASFVACLCESLKYAGTVTTASVTLDPK